MHEKTRVQYRQDLASLEQRGLDGLDMVVTALDRTLESTKHADIELAELVIADDDRIDGRYLEVHQELITMLATQSPVATDLRLISALLHVIHSIERMGDQCVNIAKLIPLSGHEPPVRREVQEALARMGACARSEVTQARAAFANRAVDLAEDLVRQDRLHAQWRDGRGGRDPEDLHQP
jgi:phosphate transport system protein